MLSNVEVLTYLEYSLKYVEIIYICWNMDICVALALGPLNIEGGQ